MQSNRVMAGVALASLVLVPALLANELWNRGDHTRALIMLSMTVIVALIAGALLYQQREPD